jgi:hypothetical protein
MGSVSNQYTAILSTGIAEGEADPDAMVVGVPPPIGARIMVPLACAGATEDR